VKTAFINIWCKSYYLYFTKAYAFQLHPDILK
jgi:hypothetical protein